MKILIFALWIFSAIASSGQGPYFLQFELSGKDTPANILPAASRSYIDQSFIAKAVDSLIFSMQAAGFLDAALDTLLHLENTSIARINSGRLYYWRLTSYSIGSDALSETRLLHYFKDSPLAFDRLRFVQEKLLKWYENNGYPFASLTVENIRIDSNFIFARIHLEQNSFIQFEDLQITGDLTLGAGFVRRLTGVVPGMPFSEEMISAATRKLNDLVFADVTGKPQLLFSPASARLSIPLRQVPANRFDGIAGFGTKPDAPNRLQFTGMLQLDLINLFNRAEQLSLHWQGPGHGTQRLNISANVPFVFSTPLTPRFQFSLLKQDTTFIRIEQSFGLEWLTTERARFSVIIGQSTTSLLYAGRQHVNPGLPGHVDSRSMQYGKTAIVHSEGFFANLMDGSFAELSLSAGNKILKNEPPLLTTGNLPMPSRQNRFALGFEGETRIPVSRLARLVLQLEAKGIFGQQLFINEMHRIGGTHSLKGIDEQAITASSYAIATVELRYFTGLNSYFSMLANGAWFEKNLPHRYEQGFPWGIAAGISLQTRPGIISVFFAMGEGPGSQFAFRNTKVHVGLTSLF